MEFPVDLKYTKEHEWVRLEDDTAVIGITAFAQDQLGDIVYVDVSTEGEELEQNEVFGTIEAVKTVSDLFLPMSGTVIEFNTALEDKPELVNSEPYAQGWIIKAQVSNPAEYEGLLSAEEYQAFIEAEKEG